MYTHDKNDWSDSLLKPPTDISFLIDKESGIRIYTTVVETDDIGKLAPSGWKLVNSNSRPISYYSNIDGTMKNTFQVEKTAPSGYKVIWDNTKTYGKYIFMSLDDVKALVPEALVPEALVPKALVPEALVPVVGLPAPEICGIDNLGASCFINSFLQFIYNIDEFKQSILASRLDNPYIQALRMVFYSMDHAGNFKRDGVSVMAPRLDKMDLTFTDNTRMPVSTVFESLAVEHSGLQGDAVELLLKNTELLDATLEDTRANPYNMFKLIQTEGNQCIMDGTITSRSNNEFNIIKLEKPTNLVYGRDMTIQKLLRFTSITTNVMEPTEWVDACLGPISGYQKGPSKKFIEYTGLKNDILINVTKDRNITTRELDTKQVIANPILYIDNKYYILMSYIVSLGRQDSGGHYIFVKCIDGVPAYVINDTRVEPINDRTTTDKGYIFHYMRTDIDKTRADTIRREFQEYEDQHEASIQSDIDRGLTQITADDSILFKRPYIIQLARNTVYRILESRGHRIPGFIRSRFSKNPIINVPSEDATIHLWYDQLSNGTLDPLTFFSGVATKIYNDYKRHIDAETANIRTKETAIVERRVNTEFDRAKAKLLREKVKVPMDGDLSKMVANVSERDMQGYINTNRINNTNPEYLQYLSTFTGNKPMNQAAWEKRKKGGSSQSAELRYNVPLNTLGSNSVSIPNTGSSQVTGSRQTRKKSKLYIDGPNYRRSLT